MYIYMIYTHIYICIYLYIYIYAPPPQPHAIRRRGREGGGHRQPLKLAAHRFIVGAPLCKSHYG